MNLFRKKDRRKVLFLHIQKTAGTSIVKIARKHYGNDMVSHGDYVKYSIEELDKVSFVSGHFGYDFASNLMASRYSFTFLRDPIERLLSFYYFCQSRHPQDSPMARLANELDIDEFIQSCETDPIARVHIWNNQVWQLAVGFGRFDKRSIYDIKADELLDMAVSHLEDFSYIGFTDTFDQDYSNILRELGLPVPGKPVVSNIGVRRPERTELSGKTRQILQEVTQLDQALYSAARLRRRNARLEMTSSRGG